MRQPSLVPITPTRALVTCFWSVLIGLLSTQPAGVVTWGWDGLASSARRHCSRQRTQGMASLSRRLGFCTILTVSLAGIETLAHSGLTARAANYGPVLVTPQVLERNGGPVPNASVFRGRYRKETCHIGKLVTRSQPWVLCAHPDVLDVVEIGASHEMAGARSSSTNARRWVGRSLWACNESRLTYRGLALPSKHFSRSCPSPPPWAQAHTELASARERHPGR